MNVSPMDRVGSGRCVSWDDDAPELLRRSVASEAWCVRCEAPCRRFFNTRNEFVCISTTCGFVQSFNRRTVQALGVVRRLLLDGHGTREAARVTGLAKTTVQRIRRALSLSPRSAARPHGFAPQRKCGNGHDLKQVGLTGGHRPRCKQCTREYNARQIQKELARPVSDTARQLMSKKQLKAAEKRTEFVPDWLLSRDPTKLWADLRSIIPRYLDSAEADDVLCELVCEAIRRGYLVSRKRMVMIAKGTARDVKPFFGNISLSQTIDGTESLTYGDTIANDAFHF